MHTNTFHASNRPIELYKPPKSICSRFGVLRDFAVFIFYLREFVKLTSSWPPARVEGRVRAALHATTSPGPPGPPGPPGKYKKADFWRQFREFDTFLGKGRPIFNKIDKDQENQQNTCSNNQGACFFRKKSACGKHIDHGVLGGTLKSTKNENNKSRACFCFWGRRSAAGNYHQPHSAGGPWKR